jgi:hypothetical protein
LTSGRTAISHTHTGREVIRALADLNDQYSFFLFLEHQFSEQLDTLDQSTINQYTSQAFPRNPFGKWIHVRIGQLPSFLNSNRGVSFGAYLSTSYEVAAGFTDKAYELLKTNNSSSVVFPKKDGGQGPEQYYRRVLTASGYSQPPKELLDTMTFVRLRRNAIIHLGASPKPGYETFARSIGPSLNTFWKNSRIRVDFTMPTIGPPSERDTLDLIKLLRVVTQKLDAHLASIIDVSGLTNFVAQELFGHENVRMNLLVRKERTRKLLARLVRDFGFSGSTAAIETAVNCVGVWRPAMLEY